MSRRTILSTLVATLLVALSQTSCDKLPANGDLDGMWQLLTIETPDGLRQVKQERVYLSIQLQLAQWTDYTRGTLFYSHFAHRGDSLFFFDFAKPSDHSLESNNDEWISTDEMTSGILDAWGIHTLDARYHILQLSGENLVLEKTDTILRFRIF